MIFYCFRYINLLVWTILFLIQGSGGCLSLQSPRDALGTQQTAERLMDLMDYPMAIQYYRHMIDKHPGQKGLRTQLGFGLIQLGEHEKAKAQLLEESRLFPQDREPLILLCYLFYLDKECNEVKNVSFRYSELIQNEFRRAGLDKITGTANRQGLRERIIHSWLKKEPNLGLPFYILGQCLKQASLYEQARAEFSRASEMGYNPLSCQIQLADLDLEARDWQGALARIHDADRTIVDKPELAFLEGYAYYGQGNTEEAIRFFQRACDLKPYWSEALKNLAKLHLIRKESSKAMELLNRVKALAPGDTAVLQDPSDPGLTRTFIKALKPAYRYTFQSDRASIISEVDSHFLSYLHDGFLDKAVNYLDRFLELYDRDASLNFKLANLLNEQKRYEESLNFASRVLELDREYKAAHDLIGNVLFTIGDFLHSVQAYQEVVRIAPNDAKAYYNLGCAHNALGESKQAEVHWRKVLQLDRPLSREESRKEGSEDTLQYSVNVYERPPAFYARLALGRLYSQKGLTALAIEEFGEAAKLVPNEPDTYYEMGEAYMRIQEREKAVACFKKYLALGGKREPEVRAFLRILEPN